MILLHCKHGVKLNNTLLCKFHLEKSNPKVLPFRYREVTETLPFFLQLLVISTSFGFQKINSFMNETVVKLIRFVNSLLLLLIDLKLLQKKFATTWNNYQLSSHLWTLRTIIIINRFKIKASNLVYNQVLRIHCLWLTL